MDNQLDDEFCWTEQSGLVLDADKWMERPSVRCTPITLIKPDMASQRGVAAIDASQASKPDMPGVGIVGPGGGSAAGGGGSSASASASGGGSSAAAGGGSAASASGGAAASAGDGGAAAASGGSAAAAGDGAAAASGGASASAGGGLPLLRLAGLRRRRVAALLQPAPSDVDIAPDPAQQPLRESHLMTRAIPWTVTVFWLAASGALLPMTAKAQALAHSGSSWSGSWGFPSAPDKSLGLQTAQTVRAARVKPAQNVVTYNTDNRSNFVEYIGAQGSSFVSDFQIGDTSSSTTGSMNTGAVSILVEGENNTVTTSTSSQSTGCQDGSILSSVLGSARPLVMREDGSVVPASGAPSDEGSSLC